FLHPVTAPQAQSARSVSGPARGRLGPLVGFSEETGHWRRDTKLAMSSSFTAATLVFLTCVRLVPAQSLGNAGTIAGSVLDPSGAAIGKAVITLRNPVSGYQQATTTAADGSFRLNNIPPNPYHVEVAASGFNRFSQDVTIRNALPVQLNITMTLAGAETSV